MGIETIGNGIKTRLETISRLRVHAPNALPDSINRFPTVLILPAETEYRTTFDSTDSDYNFRIILIFSNQDKPSSLDRMLPFMESSGSNSIMAAIDGDSTLNGSADDCKLDRNSGFGSTTWGGYTYLSTEFQLRVWA